MADIMHGGGRAQPSMGLPLTSHATERQEAAQFIFSHDNLWRDIDDNPEGDARPRNGRLRAIVARHCQARVNAAGRRFDMFEQEINLGTRRLSCETDMAEYQTIMEELRSALNEGDLRFDGDCKMLNAPDVDRFFMDRNVRYNLEEVIDLERNLRAMPASLVPLYGERGDPVPGNLAAIKGGPDDPLVSLISRKLMDPFDDYIYVPLKRWHYKRTGRADNPNPKGLEGRSIQIMAMAIECMLAVLFVAIAAIVVYFVPSTELRIIATICFSIPFLLCLIWLRARAARIFGLTVGFWAVMAVFIFWNSGPKTA